MRSFWFVAFALCTSVLDVSGQSCAGKAIEKVGGVSKLWVLDGGGVAAFSKMNINLDGSARAYSPKNYEGGALLHLCNAGKVYLPDGTSYEGSESNATCTGRFMTDFQRIGDAGWNDPKVGAISWYGVLGEGTAKIHGKTITQVKPVLQKDGSGFYVSPTSLFDASVSDVADQSRYVDPLTMPSAVIPAILTPKNGKSRVAEIDSPVAFGSFGVAINRRLKVAVPFVVGDGGPRIGEGSAALARLVAGRAIGEEITRKNRDAGQVDSNDVLWIFFGGEAAKYDHAQQQALIDAAEAAFQKWGGEARLKECLKVVPQN
jgi:hypothetical protein